MTNLFYALLIMISANFTTKTSTNNTIKDGTHIEQNHQTQSKTDADEGDDDDNDDNKENPNEG